MARTGRPKAPLILSQDERDQLVRWSRRRSRRGVALRSRIVLASRMVWTTSRWRAIWCSPATSAVAGAVCRHRWRAWSTSRGRRPPRSRWSRWRRWWSPVGGDPQNARTGRGPRWPSGRACPSRRSDGSGGPSSSSPTRRHLQAVGHPLFIEKVYDVVGLYLNPPESAVVLCVDEKSQIQACPPQPVLDDAGHPERRTHDYARNGITSLFAAFNIADGTVIPPSTAATARWSSRFLARIDAEVPRLDSTCLRQLRHPQDPPVNTWLAGIPASTCTSPRPAPAGSTRWSAGSPTSPMSSSVVAAMPASKRSKPISAPGSMRGTTIRSRLWDQDRRTDPPITRTTSYTNLRRRTLGGDGGARPPATVGLGPGWRR